MADVVEQMTGIIPTVVAGGVVMKFTNAMIGTTKNVGNNKKKSKARVGYPSTQYRPW
jgi:sorbitol-specific phosphotransferase system component IIC